MWKHKNFINLQLCAPPPITTTRNIYVNGVTTDINVGSESSSAGTWTGEQEFNTSSYTINGNTVVWSDGTILQRNSIDVLPTDTIVENGQYTTRSATPTLKFKHFFDAGTIGSGTVKFRHYSQQEPTPSGYTDCITFTGETSDFTLAIGSGGAKEWDGTVQYSTDHNTWMVWDGTAVSSVNKKLYLRGSGNTKFWTNKGAQLSLSARAACSGNLNTLLEYSNPPTTLAAYCYRSLFYGCISLTQAPTLPATTLAAYCYRSLFSGCTSLTQAPTLPATTLADYCYSSMFYGCTSLTAAPELPATTLVDWCYSYMFSGCTSLTVAPELPATTLAYNCYGAMFSDCTGLKISSTQSSEYPTAWRIPSSGTISSTAAYWNFNMLNSTGGTFTSDPSINTTYYGAW